MWPGEFNQKLFITVGEASLRYKTELNPWQSSILLASHKIVPKTVEFGNFLEPYTHNRFPQLPKETR